MRIIRQPTEVCLHRSIIYYSFNISVHFERLWDSAFLRFELILRYMTQNLHLMTYPNVVNITLEDFIEPQICFPK